MKANIGSDWAREFLCLASEKEECKEVEHILKDSCYKARKCSLDKRKDLDDILGSIVKSLGTLEDIVVTKADEHNPLKVRTLSRLWLINFQINYKLKTQPI